MKIYLKILFSILLISLLDFSCSKVTNGEYYDYVNTNSSFDGTTYDYLTSGNRNLDSMVSLLDRVNLLDSLKTKDSITLFAFENISYNNAIRGLNKVRLEQNKQPLNLIQLDSAGVDTLISKYIIPQYLTTDSLISFPEGRIVNIIRYPTYTMNMKYTKSNAEGYVGGGPQFISFSDMNNSDYANYWVSNITKAVNIKTSNGIIHILENGHEFGFGKASSTLNIK